MALRAVSQGMLSEPLNLPFGVKNLKKTRDLPTPLSREPRHLPSTRSPLHLDHPVEYIPFISFVSTALSTTFNNIQPKTLFKRVDGEVNPWNPEKFHRSRVQQVKICLPCGR